MITLTREPSTRRASTIGDDSSTRRPIGAMMRSMMRITCSSFWNVTLVSSILPLALEVDLARAVDHDFGDALVAQERLERAKTDDLVGDLLEHARPLGAGEGEALRVERTAEGLLDLAPDLDLVRQVELRVEVLDDALLDAELGVAERLAQRHLGEHSPGRDTVAARRGRTVAAFATAGRFAGWRRRELAARQVRDGGCPSGHDAQLGRGPGTFNSAQQRHLKSIPPRSVGAPLKQPLLLRRR